MGKGLAVNLLEAIARFAVAQANVKMAEHEALELAARMVENRAKGYLGHPHEWWPALKPETIERKGGLNMPLLNEGTLRDSIEHTVDGNSAFVGSNEDRAVFMELGTSGSNLTFESRVGFPRRARRASLDDARWKIALRFVGQYSSSAQSPGSRPQRAAETRLAGGDRAIDRRWCRHE